MERRKSQKGEGKIGLLIAIVVVAVGAFTGIKIIPVRVAAYEFKDVMREEARYGAVRAKDKEVHKRIMERAEGLEIPLEKKNLKVSRNASEITITAKYTQTIDLKVTQYTFSFDHKEQAPLF